MEVQTGNKYWRLNLPMNTSTIGRKTWVVGYEWLLQYSLLEGHVFWIDTKLVISTGYIQYIYVHLRTLLWWILSPRLYFTKVLSINWCLQYCIKEFIKNSNYTLSCFSSWQWRRPAGAACKRLHTFFVFVCAWAVVSKSFPLAPAN